MDPHLVDKDQRLRIHSGSYRHLPGCPYKLVALCGYSSPFFLVEQTRAMARQTVERLTESPVTASM